MDHKALGLDFVTKAVDLDRQVKIWNHTQGLAAEAVALYEKGVFHLQKHLLVEQNPNMRQLIESKIIEYKTRQNFLRQVVRLTC